ncbi:MAG TPA: BTAD domain-containing putative transcriptional regulator, partial [Herpetosiphonaceae bacterium]|nr:BTAD domain-containing putative transcriptional regulator [Herpetosiphonaceae bacterium]
MPQLTVYLLGAPRVERDGVPLDLTTRKALALLAYLAITGTTHSRDSLATLFWPESGQAHARGALRYTLAMLKHALGDEWLHATREQIGLPRRAELDVDVVRFDWLIAQWQAHGHTAEQVCPACVTSLREAVGLQRGPLLAGFTLPDSPGFDDWQFFETERLQRAQAAALAALVASYRAAGAFAEAIPYAQRWLALDPLQEAVHRELMQLYADAGQRAAALRQYTTCVQVLEAELGVTPAPETTALYHQFHTSVPEATALPPVPAVSSGARPTA